MRGEHPYRIIPIPETMGSSPHARGTPKGKTGIFRTRGIIPACAGNTSPCSRTGWRSSDHPRMRGEHSPEDLPEDSLTGSSPHARGTPPRDTFCGVTAGIIPACAGNTSSTPRSRMPKRDHPRMRGEHVGLCLSWLPSMGSSPHARGTRIFVLTCRLVMGIIPACAGNTTGIQSFRQVKGDHPRMRGEHFNAVRAATSPQGSSPHARGTLADKIITTKTQRIIPACAGNTDGQMAVELVEVDHPRMRGEHCLDLR